MGLFFKKHADEIREVLVDWEGADGCMATDRITVDGKKVGYMYREEPDADSDFDSGWRFFAGDESEDYTANPDHIKIYKLNTVCNYDKNIIPYLKAPFGTAYIRNKQGKFEKEELEVPED